MSSRKLSWLLKLTIITLVTGASSLGISLLLTTSGFEHLLGIIKPKSESAKASHNKLMSADAQNISPVTDQMNEVPKAFQGTIVYQGKLKPNEKIIALTFDDGPSPKNTAQILEILKKNDVKATFFMIGQMVKYFPEVAKQVAADGHVIGNHTWHHWYRQMDLATASSEIDRTAEIIYKTTGEKTSLFRPPGGFLNNGLAEYAKNEKYVVMMWSEQSGDAERRSPQVPGLVKNVLKYAKPGAIVLLHDGGGNRSKSVKALPEMIAGLKTEGYRFVTIPQLLEIQAQEESVETAVSPVVKNQEHPNQQINHQ
ncbi:polysaccharide deacetylase family protein [Nostoc sp. 'Peltigera malacea cyanobiont' DB3992]|uniref:polysaccharide deacetylase family protein n=1 Tax=Nostoc sp. 'Peltigera malacea cyanobiont' DB3992 TaxID=1206980 RepID=UPI000C052320|nr:polysaccharide deacetylase family protein [Nostoc sp. 'Peltigera malacea cyanobiont' DB3992]PHM09287.1 polysaccharide deacetylase [Nostoc sp. 'Peltigera malacea cyanobiont' DB3992]